MEAMDSCTVETGLLKKKPCGKPAVTHCVNCEQALCAQHAVPELNEAGRKSGKFLCKECHAAQREYRKTMSTIAQPVTAAPATAPKKPNAPAPAQAQAKDAPAKAPATESKPADDGGAIDFTPSKK